MWSTIGVSEESSSGGCGSRQEGAPADERHREPKRDTSNNRREEDQQHPRASHRHDHTKCDEPQAADVGKRTRGQIDPPRLHVLPPFGGNEGRMLHEAERTLRIALLRPTDHERQEHLPLEPESRLSGGKSLEQVTCQRLVVIEETAQKCRRPPTRRSGQSSARGPDTQTLTLATTPPVRSATVPAIAPAVTGRLRHSVGGHREQTQRERNSPDACTIHRRPLGRRGTSSGDILHGPAFSQA